MLEEAIQPILSKAMGRIYGTGVVIVGCTALSAAS
jgi:hypothetical protein